MNSVGVRECIGGQTEGTVAPLMLIMSTREGRYYICTSLFSERKGESKLGSKSAIFLVNFKILRLIFNQFDHVAVTYGLKNLQLWICANNP